MSNRPKINQRPSCAHRRAEKNAALSSAQSRYFATREFGFHSRFRNSRAALPLYFREKSLNRRVMDNPSGWRKTRKTGDVRVQGRNCVAQIAFLVFAAPVSSQA